MSNFSHDEAYYRSLPFESLCAAYAASDVMLSTPLRDGMNLVCKEYLAVHQWLQKTPCDFLLIAGDDQIDEDMFNVAPDEAWTIKVGRQCSQARFNLKNIEGMRALLKDLAD